MYLFIIHLFIHLFIRYSDTNKTNSSMIIQVFHK